MAKSKTSKNIGYFQTIAENLPALPNVFKGDHYPVFPTAKEVDSQIVDYLRVCDETEKAPTLAGLALHLGFAAREDMAAVEREGVYPPRILQSLKRGRLIIEACYEQRLLGNNPAGAIFALKNLGWTDSTTNGLFSLPRSGKGHIKVSWDWGDDDKPKRKPTTKAKREAGKRMAAQARAALMRKRRAEKALAEGKDVVVDTDVSNCGGE